MLKLRKLQGLLKKTQVDIKSPLIVDTIHSELNIDLKKFYIF